MQSNTFQYDWVHVGSFEDHDKQNVQLKKYFGFSRSGENSFLSPKSN